MKKRILSLVISCLMLLCLLPVPAMAEGSIIANLGSVRAGASLDQLVGTTGRGEAALVSGVLPDNCSIVTEQRDGSAYHYLRGTPKTAGVYEFTLAVTAAAEAEEGEERATETVATLTCSLAVQPAVPSFTVLDVNTFVGEDAKIVIEASLPDNGSLSYAWYSNSVRSNRDGKLIEDETEEKLPIDTESPGIFYFYCVITNTNNGQTAVETTPVITVIVTEPSVTAVSISALPSRQEYTVGDTLDTTGLRLLVRYSNGATSTEDSGFAVQPKTLDKAGTQAITVTYQDVTCTFPVLVSEAAETIESIKVLTPPTKKEYTVGDWLDASGLRLQVLTNKGSNEVTTGYTCSPRELTQAGMQTITVSYGDKTDTFTVTVKAREKKVSSVSVLQRPAKLTYTVGDSLDTTGLILRVLLEGGDEETVDSGFVCSPAQLTQVGTQTVTVLYNGQSCSFDVTVTAAEQQPPAVTAAPESSAPVSPRPDIRPQRSTGGLVVVIVIAAAVALAALLAYVYASQQEKLQALFRKIFKKK